MRSVSVVIPVYNSESSLTPLLERLEPVLRTLCDQFEAILVDDGSQPVTWELIETLAKTRPWLRGLRLMRNSGQHNALLCGIREARFDVIVTMDDDLQHPPGEIPRLVDALEQGAGDVIYGTPRVAGHQHWRSFASHITRLALSTALGATAARKVSAFRAFRTELRDAFAGYDGPFVSVDALLGWATTRFASVEVQHDPRTLGVSNYTLRKLVAHAIDMVTGFSTLPLQVATLIGFVLTSFGILLLALVVGRYLFEGTSVPGFPFLASIISIFSGAQLFSLGIIGAYLARMHFRSMQRPAYTVESRTSETPGC
jgi:undecaprenyl-phosphate 4-deoxy-4-formamido-L-arabinose transferase